MEEVQRLNASGAAGVDALVDLLSEPSWVVRRAVVASLARIGTPAVGPLCAVLAGDRSDEARLAAAVDALVASGGDVDPAVLALGDATGIVAVLCDVAQVLGRRKSRAAVPWLARWSSHSDDNVAVAAIEALGHIGGADAIEPLLAALRSRNFFRTFPAIAVLGRSGDPRVLGPLVELLGDVHYAVEAASALGRTGQLGAVAPLASMLASADVDRRRAAARALTDLRAWRSERFGDAGTVAAICREAVTEPGAPARIAAALDGADAGDTIALATVLGWLHDETGIDVLVPLLDADPAVADMASTALRSMGHEAEPALRAAIRTGDSTRRARLLPLLGSRRSVVAELVLCLTDADPSVRTQACGALGRIGDVSVVGDVFALVGDEDSRVAHAAIAAVQSLGSDEARTHALGAARSPNPRLRRSAVRILSYFGYPEALDLLREAIRDGDERIREAAAPGLALSDDPRATAALVAAAAHPSAATRGAVARALGHAAATPEVIATLALGLDDASPWVRYYACQSIGRLQATSLFAKIEALLDDAAGQVRVAAVEAISRVGGERAMGALERAAASSDLDVRRAALTGLGRIRRPGAFALLARAASSDDGETRLAAVLAMAQASSPEAIAALIRAAGDPDAHVRDAAFEALSHQAGREATRWLIERLAIETDRSRASSALAQPVDGRVEGILAALEVADSTMAARLVEVLLRIRGPNGAGAVEAVLQLDNVEARRAAAAALVQVRSAAAHEAILRAAEMDPDPEVRRICAASG
jgi:HEAT repeat protein